ncbi:hypothetical protein DAR30_24335 [Salmonella enterica subsp. enterica serovar Enteritidis]|nr:hypothetical protein [Salmonella enterica subsp. enterica]EBV3599655.1 hypothetical protein [Salmonella enterica subsp. enterica serovar Virchow]EBW1603708.1 hypothetical protein [Salmonella enterica subsp. enterica serovar Kottbus]EBW2249955.1 hypothetical protein [Salmonella enterica subsp. enterica serovar Enteritidis]EBW7423636.1 hypothetical protein [Salmonella enterica subsp. enterica serovar Stanley]ECF1263564.1 hypothetical protein [Salmonella enterica subsp. enterica serovar Uganda
MADYCVNSIAQPNGDHEVHEKGCRFWPTSNISLGSHYSCSSAVIAAKVYYRQSNGCYHCSRACHTT